MRILYDGTIFGHQSAGGISRFYASVIRRLPSDWTPTLLTPAVVHVNFPTHPRLSIYRWKRFKPTQLSNVLERTYFRAVSARVKPQLVHPTYYTLLTRRLASAGQFHRNYRCPVVVSVWDMIHEIYPQQMDPNGFWAARKREAVLAAQAVICISEHTRRDLLERIPIPEDKVFVVHLASDLEESMAPADAPPPAAPYFLYLGGRAEYKNFWGLLAAFRQVIRHRPDVRLATVGPPITPQEARRIEELGLTPFIQWLPTMDDRRLAGLYRQSVALVYPSRYEGFGIPPLEAMRCGTAVIASNQSSLAEVVGDAGLSFDPTASDATDTLAGYMLRLLEDPAERARLIERGRWQAAKFSWDRAASETIAIYRSIVGP